MAKNPTKTRGIEKAWRREINKRFALFKKQVIAEARRIGSITVNAFDADPSRIRAYMAFFQQELDRLIVGDWQEKYQRRSYELAINRSIAELRRQNASTVVTVLERELAGTIGSFTAVPSLGLSTEALAGVPLHADALEFLFTRSFEALQGMSNDMARQVRQILFDGAQQGSSIADVTRAINDRINVGKSRARLISQTETIQAFQRGTINQARVSSDQIGEEVKLRWLTVTDSKVRDLHRRWHGQVFTEQEAAKNINISPFNCRCALSPVIAEADTAKKREKFKKEREKLLADSDG